jgi:hypothetical protein
MILKCFNAQMLSERQFTRAQRSSPDAAIQSYNHLTAIGISAYGLLVDNPSAVRGCIVLPSFFAHVIQRPSQIYLVGHKLLYPIVPLVSRQI